MSPVNFRLDRIAPSPPLQNLPQMRLQELQKDTLTSGPSPGCISSIWNMIASFFEASIKFFFFCTSKSPPSPSSESKSTVIKPNPYPQETDELIHDLSQLMQLRDIPQFLMLNFGNEKRFFIRSNEEMIRKALGDIPSTPSNVRADYFGLESTIVLHVKMREGAPPKSTRIHAKSKEEAQRNFNRELNKLTGKSYRVDQVFDSNGNFILQFPETE